MSLWWCVFIVGQKLEIIEIEIYQIFSLYGSPSIRFIDIGSPFLEFYDPKNADNEGLFGTLSFRPITFRPVHFVPFISSHAHFVPFTSSPIILSQNHFVPRSFRPKINFCLIHFAYCFLYNTHFGSYTMSLHKPSQSTSHL